MKSMRMVVRGAGLYCVALVAVLVMTGCTGLQNKAFVAAGGVDAFKIETSGSTSTGTILPNVTAGGAVSAIATSPATDNGKTGAPVFGHSRRSSFFGELFGIDCATEAVVYIGVPGETGAETSQRLEALQKIMGSRSKTKKTDAESVAKPAAVAEPAKAADDAEKAEDAAKETETPGKVYETAGGAK